MKQTCYSQRRGAKLIVGRSIRIVRTHQYRITDQFMHLAPTELMLTTQRAVLDGNVGGNGGRT